jgi:hypothetical protein
MVGTSESQSTYPRYSRDSRSRYHSSNKSVYFSESIVMMSLYIHKYCILLFWTWKYPKLCWYCTMICLVVNCSTSLALMNFSPIWRRCICDVNLEESRTELWVECAILGVWFFILLYITERGLSFSSGYFLITYYLTSFHLTYYLYSIGTISLADLYHDNGMDEPCTSESLSRE